MAEVIMPKMGDAMEEGTLLSWKVSDGQAVKAGDVIAEIETDKSNVEVEAEEDGPIHFQAQPGVTVPVGTVIATIGEAAPTSGNGPQASAPAPQNAGVQAASSASPTPAPAAARPAATPATGNGQRRILSSPLARSVAREKGVDIAQLTGTGPNGRIVEADVLDFLKQRGTARPTATPPTAAQPGLPAPQKRAETTPAPTVSPTDLSAIRKVIARRMVESKTTIPHFYITSEIDMAEATVLREKLNSYDESLPKISFNDMILKAAAKALANVPAANAAFKDDKIYPGQGIHVGIAVALDDGLIVPVVRDADQLPLRKLAATSRELINRARAKKLQPNEYSGGTFTVSNLGGFDVENFIAIIDPAQGAILAVASIQKKAVVMPDDTIAVRPRMNATFSGDHRVMDGATGAQFLQELKRLLQNPLSLLE